MRKKTVLFEIRNEQGLARLSGMNHSRGATALRRRRRSATRILTRKQRPVESRRLRQTLSSLSTPGINARFTLKRKSPQMFSRYSEKERTLARRACRWRQGPFRMPNLKCQLQRHLPLRIMPSPSISTSQLWFSTLPVTIEPPRGASWRVSTFTLPSMTCRRAPARGWR